MKLHGSANTTHRQRSDIRIAYQEGHKLVDIGHAYPSVSSKTIGKWGNRESTDDMSTRPHSHPNQSEAEVEETVLDLRNKTGWGPDRLGPDLGMPSSTVYKILVRHGANRKPDPDEPKAAPRRYVKDHPGQMVHVDIKERAVPGGKRYFHDSVDDASRLAHTFVTERMRAQDAILALEAMVADFAKKGVVVQSILTDNGGCYRAKVFKKACKLLGIKHYRTKPYHPQTNGKVERFHRTMSEEYTRVKIYPTTEEMIAAAIVWVDHYNHSRKHLGIPGFSPYDWIVHYRENLLILAV